MTNIFETFDFRAELFTLSPRSQTVANVARPTKRGSQLVAERDGEQLASSGSDRRRSHSLLLRMIFCFLHTYNIIGQDRYTHSRQMNHPKTAKIWHIFKHFIGIPKKNWAQKHMHMIWKLWFHILNPIQLTIQTHDYHRMSIVSAIALMLLLSWIWILCLPLCVTPTIQKFANVFIHPEWIVLVTLKCINLVFIDSICIESRCAI